MATRAKWPRVKVEYYDGRPNEIITVEAAQKRFDLDERECGWIDRNEVVGTSVSGYPDVRMIYTYTLADSIRDAAPDLLKALKNLSECSKCRNGCAPNDMGCASNQARAAIAKAEGGAK